MAKSDLYRRMLAADASLTMTGDWSREALKLKLLVIYLDAPYESRKAAYERGVRHHVILLKRKARIERALFDLRGTFSHSGSAREFCLRRLDARIDWWIHRVEDLLIQLEIDLGYGSLTRSKRGRHGGYMQTRMDDSFERDMALTEQQRVATARARDLARLHRELT